MKMEDILMEIYRRKEKEITEDERKKRERLEKAVRGSQGFKQAAAQLQKLLELMSQHGLKLTDGGYVEATKLKVEVFGVDTGEEFWQKREKLEKAFLDLKITLATAGKADQQSLIRAFAEAAF